MTVNLDDLSTSQILDLYNSAASKQVAKFATRAAGLERLTKLMRKDNLELDRDENGSPQLYTILNGQAPPSDEEAEASGETEEEAELANGETKDDGVAIVSDFNEEVQHDFSTTDGILDAFKARPGTVREKLLRALADGQGACVARDDLLVAAYDVDHKEFRSALEMSLKGAEKTIKKFSLPFEIRKEKQGDTFCIRLVRTDQALSDGVEGSWDPGAGREEQDAFYDGGR